VLQQKILPFFIQIFSYLLDRIFNKKITIATTIHLVSPGPGIVLAVKRKLSHLILTTTQRVRNLHPHFIAEKGKVWKIKEICPKRQAEDGQGYDTSLGLSNS
jgi:hypothetical protein